jgi:putative serine protease PepD
MAMPSGDGPVTGARVHVLARPAGSTGVRAQEIRILAAGRTITADVGTGASVVVPIVDTSLLGAPVVDDAGALVGLVVAIDADGARVTPTAMVRRVVAQFVAGDPVVAGWLGVGLDESGTVTEVTDGSPAAGAGLRTGDTVYAADGRRTAGAEALLVILQGHAPGERITLTLERGGRTLEAEVTLGAPPTAG